MDALFAIVEDQPRMSCGSAIRNRMVQCGTAVAIVFSIAMSVGGYRYIVNRNKDLVDGMSLYKKGEAHGGPLILSPDEQVWFGNYESHASEVLRESERLGVYRAP
jgi:hypothetical protein